MAAQQEIVGKGTIHYVLIGAGLGTLLLVISGFVVMIAGLAQLHSKPQGDMAGFGFFAIFWASVFYSPIAAAVGAVAGLIFSFIRGRKRITARVDQVESEMGSKDNVWPPAPKEQ